MDKRLAVKVFHGHLGGETTAIWVGNPIFNPLALPIVAPAQSCASVEKECGAPSRADLRANARTGQEGAERPSRTHPAAKQKNLALEDGVGLAVATFDQSPARTHKSHPRGAAST